MIQIQHRRDTAANWTANHPTLAEGEIGIETDTLKIKVGDGTTAWPALAYLTGAAEQAAAEAAQLAAEAAQVAAEHAQADAEAAAALTALDVIATAADRVQTGQDVIATAADRVQTGLDAIATAADRVQTGLDVIAAAAQAAALTGTSTTSLLIEIAEKTFTTQASKQFSAGMFVLAVSDANPANYMHGQVTSYAGTTLVVNVIDIGGSGTKTDWTITVSGSRGAKGDTGTGITEESVGWTATGGTTPKTLTVDETVSISALALKASPSFTGTFNWDAASELTIATGEITATQAIHTIDTESDDASDDLVTINGGTDGRLLAIRANHTDRTIVIKSTGNINTGGSDITLDDTSKYILFLYDNALSKWVVAGGGSANFASFVEIVTGTEAAKAIAPDQLNLAGIIPAHIYNLKPVVNGDVNKLDIFTRTGGAAPDATHVIRVDIPDGNGNVTRVATAEAIQFILADAANYWSKGSLADEIKTMWLYAAWSTADSKLIWMLRGYSGFSMVSESTTVTDDDYNLLPDGSTYTRAATDYCMAVAKLRYKYYTGDTPDHTIQATGENAPQVIWNPKSDYGKSLTLTTTNTAGTDISEYSVIYPVVKQSGKYDIMWTIGVTCDAGTVVVGYAYIKTGSSTYGSATYKAQNQTRIAAAAPLTASIQRSVYLNAGDIIHGGAAVIGASGNRSILGDNTTLGATILSFIRID